jgi:hypothetical protein
MMRALTTTTTATIAFDVASGPKANPGADARMVSIETTIVSQRNAQWKAKKARQEADKAERDLQRMSRERLLPDEKTLEKVARYEAHLSRQLYKALHELEALQAKRAGGTAPLARLDVQGLEG